MSNLTHDEMLHKLRTYYGPQALEEMVDEHGDNACLCLWCEHTWDAKHATECPVCQSSEIVTELPYWTEAIDHAIEFDAALVKADLLLDMERGA